MNKKQKLKHLKIKQKRDEFVRIAFSSISPPEIITEKELLKKSGIIVMCILAAFIILLIAFNAKPALAYTGSGNASDIKANSYINTPVGLLPGTGTTGSATTSARFRWYYGTTSTTGTGSTGFFNPGSSTMTAGLPYIDFLFSNGTSTLEFNGFDNITIDGIAITTGILTDYVKSLNGTSTGLTGTNTTLNGTTTIPSTGVFSANGRVLTDIEVSYLDGLSDFLTTLLAAKQNDLGGTYCASISDDVGTRTGAIRLGVSGDLTLSIINGEFVFGQVGSISAKPSTLENGGTVTASPSFIDYDGDDFDPVGSGTGSRIKLSTAQKGSSTPTADTVIKAGGSGTVSMKWFDAGYCYVYNTVGSPTVSSGTWTNIAMNADTNESYNATHSASNNSQIKVLVGGVYEISGKILTTCDANSINIRLCKNTQSEIPGSYSTEYRNESNGLTSYPVSTGIVQVRLVANDYVYMQVASSGNIELDYFVLSPMPGPGTSTYATLSLRKVGE